MALLQWNQVRNPRVILPILHLIVVCSCFLLTLQGVEKRCVVCTQCGKGKRSHCQPP